MRGAPLATLLAAFGCSTASTPRELPTWPAAEPRVRLERVIQTRADVSSQLTFALLGGANELLFVRPYGIAWDGDDLLVTDPGAHRVARIRARGGVSFSPEGAFDDPLGLTLWRGSPVVSEPSRGRVVLLSRTLGPERVLKRDMTRPSGVASCAARLYVAETGAHRVVALSDPGERVAGRRGTGAGEFNYPAALACDRETLWVGDTLNFRLQRLSAATLVFASAFGTLGDAAGEMPRVKGLAVDAEGHLWVSDAHLDAIGLFDKGGAYLMTIGSPGSAPGQFAFPAGIAAHPDGRVAVVDSLNRRVQLFRLVRAEVPR